MISRLTLTMGLALGLILGLWWLLGGGVQASEAAPGVLYVAPGGACGGATPCYATIQAAVDAAADDALVKIAAGTYTDLRGRPAPIDYAGPASIVQVVYISKTVTLRGGYTALNWNTPDSAANPTTLDAQGQGRVLFVYGGGIRPVIEGLRMTGGNAAGLGGLPGGYPCGGGIYLVGATATIRDSRVFDSRGGGSDSFGGGLCLIRSSATLINNSIYYNSADHGDGLYIEGGNPLLDHNTIRDNGDALSGWGGGVYVSYSNAALTGNTITGNRGGYGGGINLQESPARLTGNSITGNTAERGGGLYLYWGAAILRENVITGNTASSLGGGIYFWHNASLLVNTVVNDNRLNAGGLGAGLYLDGGSTPGLLHTTIARNTGGDGVGVHVTNFTADRSSVSMTNTIVSGHPTAGVLASAGNTITLEATLWHANAANWSGAGAINHTLDRFGDPGFAADGYHLTATSAAVDQGVNAGVTLDVDGHTRPWGGGIDLGADEFRSTPGSSKVYLPLLLRVY